MIPVHRPVLAGQVLDALELNREAPLVVDGTVGEGGHSEMFLESWPGARVVGIDADEVMGMRASEYLARWGPRFSLKVGWCDEILGDWEEGRIDIVFLDLGISGFHYKGRGKGFSFTSDEACDMSLVDGNEFNASWFVNSLGEEDLADLIYRYGEEPFSRRIARRIVRERADNPVSSSRRLASIVSAAVPPKVRYRRLHPATKTFQALRIAVNHELEHLEKLLEIAPLLLASGGKLGIISFHSLEDRLVKNRFRELSNDDQSGFTVLVKKPIVADDHERGENPSSRSAKLRVLVRSGEGVVL